MDSLVGLLMVLPLLVLIFGFTGGFASAVAAGGREDRSLLQNAGIGLVGWAVAWTLWKAFKWEPDGELNWPLIAIAFAVSVGLARRLDRRDRRRAH